ncbi:sensor histidine kinase [Marinospirillum insulare]|uniref:histidine kinase n=1 Tax=Marinospirillum insulare TaxID=217169 RepID=A0ABQ5ZTM2_9GAMM|nr:ATP-binding protein [Marinospirillum insulare]GLR63334.1 hypothetical protein GCM10007878_07690 [Marinospirillum insulare]
MVKNKLLHQARVWSLPTLAGAFLLAALTLLYILQSREQEIQTAERDDVLWAAYQLDRENLKLNSLLNRYQYKQNAKVWKDARTRFEILYSRVTVLRHGQYNNLIEVKERTRDLSLQSFQIIDLMDERFFTHNASSPENLTKLLQLSLQLHRVTEELVTTLKSVSSQLNTQKRQELRQLYHYLLIIIVLLILTMSLIIYLLIKKMSEARQAQYQAQLMATELETAVQKAEAGSQAKTDFLATMSHEIRTPMNGVLGMSELLFETSLSSEQKKYTHAINNSATALMRLLNELMDISKLEAGRLVLDYRKTALAPLLNEVIDFFAAELNQKPVTFNLELAPEADAFYNTDPGRLRQVLLNLLGNAFKFTDQGRVTLRIKPTPEGLLFEVEDTGVGIDEAVQQRMFETFTQADASISRRYGGTGLAISKRIIEQMGGAIHLRSRLNEGSCFYFTLPLEPLQN